MKKVAGTIVAALTIVLAAWLIMNYAPNQKTNGTPNVSVAEFMWTSNWGPGPVGTLWGRSFNVTLHNQGTKNITGLKLEVILSENDSEIWSQTWFGNQLNVTLELQAGETRELQGGVMTTLNDLERAQGEITIAVTAKLDDTFLFEFPVP